MRCVNIGYQGKKLADFCKALAANQVQILIDVREAAWSQRPEFRKEALKRALAEHGIEYVHCKIAGNPFRPKKGETISLAECLERYTEHIEAHPAIVWALTKIITEKASALLCYEQKRAECHRGVLVDALTAALPGLVVVDL